MKLGDVLEWIAGATVVAGAWAGTTSHWSLAIPAFAGAVFLGYEAQCYGSHQIAIGLKIRTAYRRHKNAKRVAREQS